MRALFASASEIENQSCRNSQSEDWPMRANENSTSNQLNAGKGLNFASDWLRICREFPEITLDTQPKLLPLHQGIRD